MAAAVGAVGRPFKDDRDKLMVDLLMTPDWAAVVTRRFRSLSDLAVVEGTDGGCC